MKTVFILLAGIFLSIAFAFVPPKHSIVGHSIKVGVPVISQAQTSIRGGRRLVSDQRQQNEGM